VLVTPSPGTSIGEMSCNPSVGGVAKGTLVREVRGAGCVEELGEQVLPSCGEEGC
jgi:tRNA U34 5-carboxymethylaminomethyl modifying enzyme MnmG/GidA